MVKRNAIFGTLAGAMAGLEAFNRLVALPPYKVNPSLPTTPTLWKWRYGDVAVYEAGDPGNPPLLLLHGHNAAASAFEMRYPFALLSERYHVYAPDLLGYGLSDRPPIAYTPQLYMELIEDILREVVQRPSAVAASSLTSAHAIEVAARAPEWITALALFCPTGIRKLTRQSAGGKAVEAVLRLPVLGEGLFNALASHPSIRYFLQSQTYYDPTCVTDDMVDSYYNAAHGKGARYAPAAFVGGGLYWDAGDAWTRLSQRALIVWGREGGFSPVSDAAPFLATNPAAQLQVIDKAGVLPHDEQPEQTAQAILTWLQA